MSTRVFLGNLPFDLTDSGQLRDELISLGYAPKEVKVVIDRATGTGRGFAFVEMDTPQAATELISTINGQRVFGRPIRADKASEKPSGGGGGRGGGGGGGGYGGGGGAGGGGGYGGGGGHKRRDDGDDRRDRRRSKERW
jgi:cold-inducible RNA-binding protein